MTAASLPQLSRKVISQLSRGLDKNRSALIMSARITKMKKENVMASLEVLAGFSMNPRRTGGLLFSLSSLPPRPVQHSHCTLGFSPDPLTFSSTKRTTLNE